MREEVSRGRVRGGRYRETMREERGRGRDSEEGGRAGGEVEGETVREVEGETVRSREPAARV